MCSLLVGWLFNNAFIGLALIWVGMILYEVLSQKKPKTADNRESEESR
jgi:hypothetical protein